MFARKPRYRDDDYRSGAMHSRHLERVDGGYRVLDWEAVEYALDELCRRRKGEDPKALAEEHAHETTVWAHLAKPIVVTSLCAVCGSLSARVEIVAPGKYLPSGRRCRASSRFTRPGGLT